jgi:hypothetical protein
MKRLFATTLARPLLALVGTDAKSWVATDQASNQGMAAGCEIMTQTKSGDDCGIQDFIRLIFIRGITQRGAFK